LLKNVTAAELQMALTNVTTAGFHMNDLVSGAMPDYVSEEKNTVVSPALSKRQLEMLKRMCTELSYKEIAEKMFVSPRTIDNYREELLKKLNVQSRVGFVLFAIKEGLVESN
jgi:DNA-binding NarL/FixJ family response regulator